MMAGFTAVSVSVSAVDCGRLLVQIQFSIISILLLQTLA